MLLYHLVFPSKYRRSVFIPEVEETLRWVCLEIEKRYEIRFVEIGMEEDHVHLLVQGVPTMPVTRIVTIIKSITAREIFKAHPRIKKDVLWGWEPVDFWLLCQHGWHVCQQGHDKDVYSESREKRGFLQETI